MNQKGWVQVEREKELREAALVELRPCGFCGRTERFILLHRVATTSNASLTAEGDFTAAGSSWSVAPGLCVHPRRPFDPSAAIATGRLWRRVETQEQVTREETTLAGGRTA
ncbi:MAG TPA: hypothetical protein VGP07_18460 [Polyangia bacterium]|jgi:hypothetical protein